MFRTSPEHLLYIQLTSYIQRVRFLDGFKGYRNLARKKWVKYFKEAAINTSVIFQLFIFLVDLSPMTTTFHLVLKTMFLSRNYRKIPYTLHSFICLN